MSNFCSPKCLMTLMTNDFHDCIVYKMKIKHFLTKSLSENAFLYAEIFVPLHCQKKDRIWRPGQPKIVFRPGRIYGLPSA